MSVFFDQDGDGIAEASQRLISGIAFDFDQRPPDPRRTAWNWAWMDGSTLQEAILGSWMLWA